MIALDSSIPAKPGSGAPWARLGLAVAGTAAASFTVLQAVDGVALKRAVDAWASASADQKVAAFAAAEAIRWIEIGVNALSYVLLGLTLVLSGLAIALGSAYPRSLGGLAGVTGIAFLVRGVLVAFQGFVPSIPGLAALVLFGLWIPIIAFFMWRASTPAQLPVAATSP